MECRILYELKSKLPQDLEECVSTILKDRNKINLHSNLLR